VTTGIETFKVSKRVKVVGPFSMGPKTGTQKGIPASLFPFFDRGNYSRDGKNGVLIISLAQARLRFAYPQLRLKQQLLRSYDGNGNCSCGDSDVEFAESQMTCS
jgi:hypothetical protein